MISSIRNKIKYKLAGYLGYTPTNVITDYIIKLIIEELPEQYDGIEGFNLYDKGWNDCLAAIKENLGIENE